MLDMSPYLNIKHSLATDIVGQLLILSVFWGGAIINILNWKTAINYIESRRNLSGNPLILTIGILWQFIGGLFLIDPSTRNLGVISLILFTVTSSLLCYNFWQREGVDKYMNMLPFLSNIGIIGALLLFLDRPQFLDWRLLSPVY